MDGKLKTEILECLNAGVRVKLETWVTLEEIAECGNQVEFGNMLANKAAGEAARHLEYDDHEIIGHSAAEVQVKLDFTVRAGEEEALRALLT